MTRMCLSSYSRKVLKYLRSQGALRIDDLLVPENRQLFGWPLLLTDVIALVDKAVLVHGDVINMRAAVEALTVTLRPPTSPSSVATSPAAPPNLDPQ
jgi:hypothetical protein